MTWRRKLLWWTPAALHMSIITWFSHQPSWPDAAVGHPDWFLHGAAFGLLALLCLLGASQATRLEGARPWVAALLVTVLAGALDEWHQSWIPGRDAAVADWMADCAGAVVSLTLVFAARSLRGGPERMGESRGGNPPPLSD